MNYALRLYDGLNMKRAEVTFPNMPRRKQINTEIRKLAEAGVGICFVEIELPNAPKY